FTCVAPHAEDEATTRYMMATALEAGLKAKFIRLGDIGWTDRDKRFWDLENVAIDRLFKLYPWEWMLADPFGAQLLANPPAMMFNP
ncbi:glutathionylspermidine synthase family protein, partial [Acinetobacter baumannii]